MTMRGVVHWFRQPTTIGGLMSVAGAATAAALHGPVTEWAPMLAVGAVGMVLPDNTVGRSAVEKLVLDVLVAVGTRRVAQGLPGILADGQAVLSEVETTTTASTTPDGSAVEVQTTTKVPVHAVGDPP